MNEQHLYNEIQQLQQARSVAVLESIMVMIFVFLNAAVLPQILYQYLIATASIDPNSPIFEHFTLIVYLVALVAVLWVAVTNFLRVRKIRQLQSDLELLHYVGPGATTDSETTETLALALEEVEAGSFGKSARRSRKAASTSRATRSTRSAAQKTSKKSRAKNK